MAQTSNDTLERLLKLTERDLSSLMPVARERILKRMRAMYWQGVADTMAAAELTDIYEDLSEGG